MRLSSIADRDRWRVASAVSGRRDRQRNGRLHVVDEQPPSGIGEYRPGKNMLGIIQFATRQHKVISTF